MAELTKSDTELVFRYLPDSVRGDITYDAWDRTLNEWQSDRADALDQLETANDDPASPFDWQFDLSFEAPQVDGREELVPHTHTGDADAEIHDLANDFAWDYVDNVRDRVRRLQQSTVLSPREFVAYVLSESHLTYAEAANEMDISEGTFASKMSREVRAEIERARKTVKFAERLAGE